MIPTPGKPVRGSRTGRPLMALLDLLGRRWTLRVLWELRRGPLTFAELQRRCDAMSPSVLNQRISELRAASHHRPCRRRLPINGGRKKAVGVDRTARRLGQAVGSSEVTCLRTGCLRRPSARRRRPVLRRLRPLREFVRRRRNRYRPSARRRAPPRNCTRFATISVTLRLPLPSLASYSRYEIRPSI